MHLLASCRRSTSVEQEHTYSQTHGACHSRSFPGPAQRHGMSPVAIEDPAVAKICVSSMSTRTLFWSPPGAASVRRRFGAPQLPNAQQYPLTVDAACLLQISDDQLLPVRTARIGRARGRALEGGNHELHDDSHTIPSRRSPVDPPRLPARRRPPNVMGRAPCHTEPATTSEGGGSLWGHDPQESGSAC